MSKEINYPFSNAIIFAKVMEDPTIVIPFLERVFAGRKIDQVIVTEKIQLKTEVVLQPNSIKTKGIRLDVLFKDENAWYDIEMQVTNKYNLPKRSRYYHGALDTQALSKGADYNTLKKSYVIFICEFDPFKKDIPVYYFENYDVENDLPLNDESYTIMVNTKSTKLDIPEELKNIFDYINTGEFNPNDSLLVGIHSKVEKLQGNEEVLTIITLEQQHEIEKKWERNEAKLKVAIEMKTAGEPIEKIAKYTKLSIEEIEKL